MQSFRQLSLRNQMLMVVVGIVLLGFALTLFFFSQRASQIQRNTAILYVQEMAADHGAQAAIPLQGALEAARTLAAAVGSMQASGYASRQTANAMLREILDKNPGVLAVWTGGEPQAFDERDSEFADTRGHDATGRFVPYWSRGGVNGALTVEPLVDYDKPGDGDFYQ
ncbi:MAG: PDC sensor domain-containing protein, partial [Comamonas sp.]|nr:PDC sensor domain-containing protein [Comamonas sp.]